MLLISTGLVKKLLIADYLANNLVAASSIPGPVFQRGDLVAVYAFALQLFFDFSGYTDIAMVRRCCWASGCRRTFASRTSR